MDKSEQLKDIIDRLGSKIGELNISVSAAESAAMYWQAQYNQTRKELDEISQTSTTGLDSTER